MAEGGPAVAADGVAAARIASVRLDAPGVVRYGPDIAREREAAIRDLLAGNQFAVRGGLAGPYDLAISMHGAELVLDITGANAQTRRVTVALSAFRQTIKAYFAVCESYYEALRHAGPSQIEAVDMGRRGLHNEAAEMLQRRLARAVEVDLPTARRLFTLLCVLQIRR